MRTIPRPGDDAKNQKAGGAAAAGAKSAGKPAVGGAAQAAAKGGAKQAAKKWYHSIQITIIFHIISAIFCFIIN